MALRLPQKYRTKVLTIATIGFFAWGVYGLWQTTDLLSRSIETQGTVLEKHFIGMGDQTMGVTYKMLVQYTDRMGANKTYTEYWTTNEDIFDIFSVSRIPDKGENFPMLYDPSGNSQPRKTIGLWQGNIIALLVSGILGLILLTDWYFRNREVRIKL